jgi:hypothetical protein
MRDNGPRSIREIRVRNEASFAFALLVGVAVLEIVVPSEDVVVRNASLVTPTDGYLPSDRCRDCHPAQWASWSASYHPGMTQWASPQSVRGNFDDLTLTLEEETWRLTQRDGDYMIDVPGRFAENEQRSQVLVELVTGSHHMQNYWYRAGSDQTMSMLPFVWLIEDELWIPFRAAFVVPPSSTISLEVARWNQTCLRCHTTHPRSRPLGDGYDTQVVELGIGCQSCHGPADTHAEKHRNPLTRYAHHLTDLRDPSVVHPGQLDPVRSAQVCGQCHGIMELPDDGSIREFLQHGYTYRPGDDLELSRIPFRPDQISRQPRFQAIAERWPLFVDGSFWPDGNVRVSGREYNGLIESPCFYHGDPDRGVMTCLSCHSMHEPSSGEEDLAVWADDQLAPGMRGDTACVSCHDQFGTSAEVAKHTRHAVGSSGSLCYNCHMPHTTYGLLKAIRSHTVTSPEVAVTLATGRPNACNVCHLDRTLAWTARWLNEWYDQPRPALGYDRSNFAESVLWAMRGDAGQRVLAAWSFGWQPARDASSGTDWPPLFLLQLLDDPYDAVRFVAWRSLTQYEGFAERPYDFGAPREQRLSVIKTALGQWGRRPRATRPEVLMGVNGAVHSAEMERLRGQRDDRDVSLQE